MKLTVTFEANNMAELMKEIDEGTKALVKAAEGTDSPAKAEKPAKAKKEKAPPPTEEEAEAEDDLGFEEEDAEEEESSTTIDDILKAFRDFAQKKEGNREKAKKILAKLGVKSARDIPEGKFAEALKLLK